jgi:hypothetical protein
MKTLTLTDADFDSNGIYIGKTDITSFNGNLKIETNCARFLDSVNVNGYIKGRGSIKSRGSIRADNYIKFNLTLYKKPVY